MMRCYEFRLVGPYQKRYIKYAVESSACPKPIYIRYDRIEKQIVMKILFSGREFLQMFIDHFTIDAYADKKVGWEGMYQCVLAGKYEIEEFEQMLEQLKEYCSVRRASKGRKVPNQWEKYTVQHPDGVLGIKYNPAMRQFVIGGKHKLRSVLRLIYMDMFPGTDPKVTSYGYNTYRLSAKVSDTEFHRAMGELRERFTVDNVKNMLGTTR